MKEYRRTVKKIAGYNRLSQVYNTEKVRKDLVKDSQSTSIGNASPDNLLPNSTDPVSTILSYFSVEVFSNEAIQFSRAAVVAG